MFRRGRGIGASRVPRAGASATGHLANRAVDQGKDAERRFGFGNVERRKGLPALIYDADAPLAAHSVGRNLHSARLIFLVSASAYLHNVGPGLPALYAFVERIHVW